MEEKLNIFSKPEQIDNFIKSKLRTFPRNNGKSSTRFCAWTKEELELRDAVIMQYITEQGLSKDATATQIQDRWEIALSTAKKYVSEAVKRFALSFAETTQEEHRKVWMERCEQILQDAIDSRDKASALKALDLMGRSMGIYQEKKDVNLSGEAEIHFDFS